MHFGGFFNAGNGYFISLYFTFIILFYILILFVYFMVYNVLCFSHPKESFITGSEIFSAAVLLRSW